MPIPLIVWGLGAVATAGLGLGAKAVVDNSKANDLNSKAQSISSNAEKKLDKTKTTTNDTLQSYGQQKLDAYESKIGKFVSLYDQLKNVEINRSSELDKLMVGNFANVNISDIKQSYSALASMTQGFVTGIGGGALAAYGAYTGTMAFATAGTGAAISGLSGVAATNATLAWLGGGTLAAGGTGMAGGMLVLGGLVAAPASLIFGGIFAAKASQKLSEAGSNVYNSKNYSDEVDIVCQKLVMIQDVTNLASTVLSNTSGKLRRANLRLAAIIEESGADYTRYSEIEKDDVFKSVKYAQLVKAIIDSPILTEDGGVNNEIQGKFKALANEIN